MENRLGKTTHNLLPHLALVGSNLLWAFDYPLYHLLLPKHLHPTLLLTLALGVTAIFAIVAASLSGNLKRIDKHDIPMVIGAALLIGVLHKGCMMFGLSRSSPIDGSIINTAGPLIVLSISVAAGIDRLTKLKVAGLTLGLAGAIAVIIWGGAESHEKSGLIGNLLITAGVASTALYTVWLKSTLEKYSVTTLLVWVYSIATIISLPFGIGSGIEHGWGVWNRESIIALVAVLLMLTWLPNFLFNYGLQSVRPMETSIYGYLQPIAAIIISVAMGLDKLQADTLLFAAVVFIGIALVVYSYRKQEVKP